MIIRTLTEYQDFAQHFNWNILSFDTETTDLDWFKLEIEGISLYDGKHACYIDLWENQEQESILKEFWMQFSSAGTLIGHNLPFDLEVLAKLYGKKEIDNLMLRCNLIDTYLADYLIDECTKHSLKGVGGCCERYLCREALTYEEAKKYARNSPEWAKYATDDAVNAWDVWQKEAPILKEQYLEKVFDIECKFIPVQVEMELTGVLLDQEYLKHIETDLDLQKIELEEKILKSLGDHPLPQGYLFGTPVEALGLDSPKRITKLIKEKFGVDVENSDKYTIQNLLDKHEFFPLFQRYKVISTLLKTYVTPYWGLVKPDGRIHCEFNIIRSGRSMAQKPNLQNQAKENELVPDVNIRKLLKASGGKKFIRLDYSGQELRLLAHCTNDSNMINAFHQDYDVHLFSANMIQNLGIPNEFLCEQHPEYKKVKEYYSNERTKFKAVNFGLAYGKSINTFAKEWGVEFWQAKQVIDQFFNTFPMIKAAKAKWENFLKENRYTTTWMGRRRRFGEQIEKGDFRAGWNHLFQGGGADMMKKAAGEVWRYIRKIKAYVKIVLIVHDEIILEVDERIAEWLVPHIQKIMNNTMQLRVPVKTDVKIVNSYGD